VRPSCVCATTAPPLPIEQVPQFVLLTHDDATNDIAVGAVGNATTGLLNPHGCAIPATFFTSKMLTDCAVVQAAWQAGDEIATHTISHLELGTGFTGGAGGLEGEIVGERDFLVDECGLPADDVVGFRSPYLIHNPDIRKVLSTHGFLYDSTINEHWPMPTSPTGGERLWPYTMDSGIPQDCAWTSNLCLPTEKYPGMWEVPVWVMQTETYPIPAYSMDYCDGTGGPCDALELMKSNFLLAYNGNRAPVPLYIHSPWLATPKYQAATRAFAEWVTTNYKDAYFVTMHQLVQWAAAPVPKDQVGAWLGCGPGGRAVGAGGAAPAAATPAAPVVTAVAQAVVAAAAPVAPAATIAAVAAAPAAAPAAPASGGARRAAGAATVLVAAAAALLC
jgi:peptidoglycan/xylan/chitin deacetylase (PgdA/CDA1 family)